MKNIFMGIVALTGLTIATSALGQMCMMNLSMIRHHFVMSNGIGEQYRSKSNPLSLTDSHITSGKRLYMDNCASCHGASGRGDGPAGADLNPRPANISLFVKMPMASDRYLYWTIAEGGVPLGSAMPPFKSVLGENEIWEIILYLNNTE